MVIVHGKSKSTVKNRITENVKKEFWVRFRYWEGAVIRRLFQLKKSIDISIADGKCKNQWSSFLLCLHRHVRVA